MENIIPFPLAAQEATSLSFYVLGNLFTLEMKMFGSPPGLIAFTIITRSEFSFFSSNMKL